MSKASAVSSPGANTSPGNDFYDHYWESTKLVDKLVKDTAEDIVLENGMTAF